MNPNESQVNNPMNADQSAAALSFATMLQEQMMPNAEMPMEATETQENAPEQDLELETEETAQVDPEALKSDILKDVEKMLKKEIGGIKEMIKEGLKDDDKEDQT